MNITAEHDIQSRNGKAEGYIRILADGVLAYAVNGNLLSDRTREMIAKKSVEQIAALPECPADFDAAKTRATIVRQLMVAADQLPEEQPEPETVPQDRPERRPAPSPDQGNYVLTPGAHTTDAGDYIEVGSGTFANNVLSQITPGTLYRRAELPGQVTGQPGSQTFRPSTNESIRRLTDTSITLRDWVTKGKGENQVEVLRFSPCNRDHAALILDAAATHPNIQNITSFARYPLIIRTLAGELTTSRPGYDLGVYYDQPPELKDLDLIEDTETVRTILDDWLVDFPFATEADRQNAIAAAITPLIRNVVSGVPGFLAGASVPGTGKGKLIGTAIGRTITGSTMPTTQLHEDEGELEKRLISTLIKGDTLINFDNLPHRLDSASLASLITTPTFTGRVLGSSKMLDLPNNLTIFLTGNNVACSEELTRRLVPITLQPATDQPELRDDFHHPNLELYIDANRRRILGALLGMVMAWQRAGSKPGPVKLGSFEDWAATVSGVLHHYGYRDFLTNRVTWKGIADEFTEDLKALVAAWIEEQAGLPLTAGELYKIAAAKELFPGFIGGKEGKPAETAFGMRVLRLAVDRPIGQHLLHRVNTYRPAVYSLRENKEVQL